ncbi:MAG: hypothetical protein KDH17_20365 [Rhodocyclaceae bacterium]|nr:hypothetical protein [Rhodocyclaceae bacterium]
MAGHPKDRKRFTTNIALLERASTVALCPAPDRAVFYAEDEGASLAATFVADNPGHQRLDELLQLSPEGKALWQELIGGGRPWSAVEEVWWELSWRLARAAKGHVHVFGPARLIEDRPLSEYRHKYVTGAYANTVFEKVELPELEQNPSVTGITYNGRPFG